MPTQPSSRTTPKPRTYPRGRMPAEALRIMHAQRKSPGAWDRETWKAFIYAGGI